MARIRTIKPEFFTSEDICSLTVNSRLTYVGLWCHADREGRLKESITSLAAQILPYDMGAFRSSLQELCDHGLILRYSAYGKNYLYIPTFKDHQRPHKTERASIIPPIEDGELTVNERVFNGELTVNDTLDERESPTGKGKGKGKGKDKPPIVPPFPPTVKRATAAPDQFAITDQLRQWAAENKITVDLDKQTELMLDHFRANGKSMKDWTATWRNWMRKAQEYGGRPNGASQQTTRQRGQVVV